MGKGLRSKVKRRFRTVKRVHVHETIEKPTIEKLNKRVKDMLQNKNVYKDFIKPPNKFLYPDDENAVIPQHKILKSIDFRSEALPLSGFAAVGNRRKYDLKEKVEIQNQYGSNIGLYDNAEISKLIEDMHKRSKEVMKTLQANNVE
ncbi:conserved protein, unknown function [Plasmodium chabaudi chabaudi]|uniref:DUF2423 domain-containing protein n=2 Tax=Plasmodium chabaudi TaxID=5825 RepID=A0A077TK97_PLACU|nr:conserved protein, unknown function [Plasmodium chabaudi chabaudi]SCM20159.1 conserved protein, unknown function [Plasmodium chabaudi adami]SCM21039.1 conserved protein, unknown function [Plasmodium chabaudi chabaudi]SCN59548.1 conserved protein, unknown function [Plasmodium chabaudi adami]VTZ68350.1 conserved protein, unknown function [Plasmodium chabaudi chabaudi]|eukprot:XP_742749.2 conserved Plasmodium protein, unknown function [Plasmodium chabaudi chabaudi]